MIIKKEHFNLEHIFECGQAFRYKKIEVQHYEVIAEGRRIRLRQDGENLYVNEKEALKDSFIESYLDLDSDYGEMKQQIVARDPRLEEATNDKWGIRILRQDPFEMLITFILSQNKSMPQIMVLVERLAQTYGKVVEDEYGTYYSFPRPEALSCVDEATFRALKVGFRAPYLVDAISKVNDGRVDLNAISSLETKEARTMLMSIKGVGRKVADCILLFAYHRTGVFPLDVWMKRIMNHLYSKEGKLSDQAMLEEADRLFGDLAGIAQQYMFYHYIKKL